MKRRLTAAVLSAAAALSLAAPACAADFSDVAPVAWYAQAVDYCQAQGLMSGTGEGRFSPGAAMDRAMLAAVLHRVAGSPQASGEAGFTDVNPGSWYEQAVNWAAEAGITSGYGGGTVAGPYGQPVGGYNDAGLAQSYFKYPWAVAPFLDGYAVSDAENNAVRLIRTESIQTVNGSTTERLATTQLGVAFAYPTGLAADEEGNLYVSDTHNNTVRKISPKGVVATVAEGLSEPMGLCWHDGALYVAESGADRVVRIVKGRVELVAGSGQPGLADGPAAQAAFSIPQGITVGGDGTVYVSDTGNSAVRRVRGGVVDTLAARDMASMDICPVSPVGLLLRQGRLYVCDTFSHRVFVLDPEKPE